MKDGKLPARVHDLTGQTFGYLTATKFAGTNGHHALWAFRCRCGETVTKSGTSVTREVRRGGTPNCGCSTGDLMAAKLRTHGMSKHPAFAVWRSMLDRCRLPSHRAWENYGGRGITVCERWQESFENFWQDMGHSYSTGLDLDRRDNDSGYTPENCRWVPRRTNTMNKRNTVRTVDVPALSAATGIGRTTLYNRIKSGWPLDKLTLPPDVRNRCSTSSTAGRATGS